VRTSEGEVDLHAVSYGDPEKESYQFRRGLSGDVYRALATKDAVAVSEPYAFRRGLSLGSALDIFTDHGFVRFEVAGVYADYASDEGGILMARSRYDRHFDDRGISAMGLVAARGANLDALQERVRTCAGDEQALVVRKQGEILDASLAIFDRTFAITTVLRLLSILVSFFGILSALSALALERARELAVLRAIGMTPKEVRRMVTLHTALLGLSAAVLSIPLGFLLALLLVHVINRRSFGWSLELIGSPNVALEALALSLAAALLSGLYPAWKMSRASPAAALRDE
jgi:putative ABC transport system permease protein